MNQQEIIDFINNHFVYKPDWNIKARMPMYEIDFVNSRVILNYDFPVVDSISKDPSNGLRARGEAALDVKHIANEKTARAILLMLMFFAELHEVREFVSFDGERPFDPHSARGEAAFAEAMAIPVVQEILKEYKVFG